MSRVRLVAATISIGLVVALTASMPSIAANPEPADALVTVAIPDSVDVDDVRVELDGTDITDLFELQEGPRFLVGIVGEPLEG